MSDIFSIFKLNLLNHCLFYNNIWNILGHSYDWRLVIKIYILTFCNRTSSRYVRHRWSNQTSPILNVVSCNAVSLSTFLKRFPLPDTHGWKTLPCRFFVYWDWSVSQRRKYSNNRLVLIDVTSIRQF